MTPESPEVTALYNAVFDAERYEGRDPKQVIADALNEAFERGRLSGIVPDKPKPLCQCNAPIIRGYEPDYYCAYCNKDIL